MSIWGNRNKFSMEGSISGRQARKFVQNTKMCKYRGCNDIPGGHQFKFPGSKEYCTEHARIKNNERAEKVEKRIVKRAEDKKKKGK